jgi:hypothetical protein
MPFLNLDDNFADHPKVDALSDGAFRLHVAGLLYASKHTTDGYIPATRVTRLMRTYKARHLAELMASTLWRPADAGYTIHDYLDWNRSREQIEADRERLRKVRSAAGKKGAQARWHSA